jgi:hypothetical protein
MPNGNQVKCIAALELAPARKWRGRSLSHL